MAIGSHHSAAAKSQTWLTPRAILAPLGAFDLDPCGRENWPTAAHHYCLPQDGLALPWFGRVYLNPPYEARGMASWLGRMVDHGRGVALLFARTETDWFFRFIWEQATALRFLRGRLHFHHEDGRRAEANAGAPSLLIGYGAEELEVLEAHPHPGQFVPLRFPRSWLIVTESWREVVLSVLRRRRGPVALTELYAAVRNHPITRANPNWRAKVRQTLQRARCRKVGRACYAE